MSFLGTGAGIRNADDVLLDGLSQDEILSYNAINLKWENVQPASPGSPDDATDSSKGIVQLTGDLGGTADSPKVPGLSDLRYPDADKVLYVSSNGSNSNTGRSPGDALASIGAALALVGSYGVVKVVSSPSMPVIEYYSWGLIPAGVRIEGVSRRSTMIVKSFSGDLCALGSYGHMENLTIDLQGDTNNGGGIRINNGTYQQSLNEVAIINGDDPCIYFEASAGSGFRATGLSCFRHSAGTGTDRFAVVIEDSGFVAQAVPRRFTAFDSEGTCSIHFGSSNNTMVVASILGDTGWSPDSRAVSIVATRLLNDMELTVDGHNNSIVSCDINPLVTISAGADSINIGPGSFNRLPVVDNSGNGRNNVFHASSSGGTVWSPSFTSSGSTTEIGNGTISGQFSRSGSILRVTYQLVIGSTTDLGSDELRFLLPYSRGSGSVDMCGQGLILSSTTSTVFCQIVGAVDYVRLLPVNSGVPVSGVAPTQLATGDVIRFTASYQQ